MSRANPWQPFFIVVQMTASEPECLMPSELHFLFVGTTFGNNMSFYGKMAAVQVSSAFFCFSLASENQDNAQISPVTISALIILIGV